jgi:hypothetical protein
MTGSKSQCLYSCLIKEANAYSALIANTANDEQSRLRASIEKIQAETTTPARTSWIKSKTRFNA